jgi:hypothetical protein
MSSNFTNNRQPAYRRLSAHGSTRATDSPAISIEASTTRPSTPSVPQQPSGYNLFASLVYNRQEVYQARSAAPFAPCVRQIPTLTLTGPEKEKSATPSTGTFNHSDPPESPRSRVSEEEQETSDSDDTGMLRALNNPMAPISKTPKGQVGGAPRKTSTKTAESRKRPPPKSTPSQSRVSKIQKTEANSKKKLDNKVTSRACQSSTLSRSPSVEAKSIEVIEISDDEDVSLPIFGEDEEDFDNDSNKFLEMIKLDDDSDEDEPLIQKRSRLQSRIETAQVAPVRPHLDAIDVGPSWDLRAACLPGTGFPESESDLHPRPSGNNLQNELSGAEKEYEQELQQLREQLKICKAEAAQSKGVWEKLTADAELKFLQMETKKNSEITNLNHQLRSETEKVRSVTQEKNQLAINLDIINKERSEVEHLREKDKKEHERIIKSRDTEKPTEDFLVAENARLRQEKERLKSAASIKSRAPATPTSPPYSYPPGCIFNTPSSQNCTTLSPVPSNNSSSSEEEKKVENIRKTYMKVKKQLDSLHAAAVNITTCTRSMDLTSFGEFGQYIRQLRKALADGGNEQMMEEARLAMAARGKDGDDIK